MAPYSRLTLGVLASVATFGNFFIKVTVIKALGIELNVMRTDFDTDTWILGSIFALIECFSDMFGLLAGPIGRMFGVRPVVMAGAVMVIIGIFVTSQTQSIVVVAISLDIILASGYSVVNVLTRATLGEHFDNNQFALASGFSQAGVSISLMVMPLVFQLFLTTYGWRGATLLLSSLSANLLVFGALLIPSTDKGYQPLLNGSNTVATSSCEDAVPKRSGTLRCLCTRVADAFDLTLLTDWRFWIIAIIFVTVRVSKGAWYIYFVPHAVAKGFSAESAALILTAAGFSHLICVLLTGVAMYKERITSTCAAEITLVLMSVSLLVDPWLTSGWLVAADVFLFAGSMGSVLTLCEVMIKEFLGNKRMAYALGWMGFLSGLFRFFSGFVPGWIYDNTGSYDLAFLILGIAQATTLIPLIARRILSSECCCQMDSKIFRRL